MKHKLTKLVKDHMDKVAALRKELGMSRYDHRELELLELVSVGVFISLLK